MAFAKFSRPLHDVDDNTLPDGRQTPLRPATELIPRLIQPSRLNEAVDFRFAGITCFLLSLLPLTLPSPGGSYHVLGLHECCTQMRMGAMTLLSSPTTDRCGDRRSQKGGSHGEDRCSRRQRARGEESLSSAFGCAA